MTRISQADSSINLIPSTRKKNEFFLLFELLAYICLVEERVPICWRVDSVHSQFVLVFFLLSEGIFPLVCNKTKFQSKGLLRWKTT